MSIIGLNPRKRAVGTKDHEEKTSTKKKRALWSFQRKIIVVNSHSTSGTPYYRACVPNR
jgi:hypothetical protein